MEMKGIEVETGLLDKGGPSDQMLETKTEAKESSKVYCKLQCPADDIYSEAVFSNPPLKQQPVKPTKLTWSRNHVLLTLCIVLVVICLGELIIIFIVTGKTAPTSVGQVQRMVVAQNEPRFPCNKNSQKPATKFSETGTESGAAAGPSSSPDATEDVRKAPDSHRCPDNWLFFANDCFYLSKERKTWSKSREFCKNNAGDLVVPTPEIKDFLMKQASIEYWIGLQYDTSWKWVNNTTPSSKPTGESKHGHCAMLGKNPPRSWESAKCVFNLHFICHK
ncbi:unnamed protein product [Lota lota]